MNRRPWLRIPAVAALVTLVVGLAGGAPAQAAPTSDSLVQSWYSEFLDRSDPETDPGRYYWVDKIDRGQRPSDVLWSLLHSYEYNNLQVSAYYNYYLDRPADSGANYWINSTTNNGMALEWVAQNIMASPEYIRINGYSWAPNFYVWDWYVDMLGRVPSDGERAYWHARSGRIGSLNAVREIYYSDEAVRARVDDNYVNLLWRNVDFAGLNYWYPKQIESDVNVKTLLATTPEYLNGRGTYGY